MKTSQNPKTKKAKYNKNRQTAFKINMLGENDKFKTEGSIYGKIILNLGLIFSLILFAQMVDQMYDQSSDIIIHKVLPNDFKTHYEQDMTKTNFMHIIEVRRFSANFDHSRFDIFDSTNPSAISKFDIDYQKLKKYFQIQLVLRERIKGVTKIITKDFKKCTKQDLVKNEFYDEISFFNSFCPDLTNIEQHYKIQNGYSNQDVRYSFSVQIVKCQSEEHPSSFCKDATEINLLLDQISMTQYAITEKTALYNLDDNLGKRPISRKNLFQYQFQISLDKYMDNINNLQYHQVLTRDSRTNIFAAKKKFEFLDLVEGKSWTGNQFIRTYLTSYDDGLTYHKINRHILYGSYHFYDEQYGVDERILFNHLDNLSKFGGLFGGIMGLIIVLTIALNYNAMLKEFIEQMYFPKRCTKPTHQYEQANFNFFEIFSDIPWMYPITYLFKNKAPKKDQFQFLKKNLETQMNLYNMISRIQKLTALVTLMMKDNQKLKWEAEEMYLDYLHACQQQKEDQINLYEMIDEFGQEEISDNEELLKEEQQAINQFEQKQKIKICILLQEEKCFIGENQIEMEKLNENKDEINNSNQNVNEIQNSNQNVNEINNSNQNVNEIQNSNQNVTEINNSNQNVNQINNSNEKIESDQLDTQNIEIKIEQSQKNNEFSENIDD